LCWIWSQFNFHSPQQHNSPNRLWDYTVRPAFFLYHIISTTIWLISPHMLLINTSLVKTIDILVPYSLTSPQLTLASFFFSFLHPHHLWLLTFSNIPYFISFNPLIQTFELIFYPGFAGWLASS
jgi:hypothetical protein